MRRVTDVKVLGDYRLGLTFDDGAMGVVDLSALVGNGVFALWRDRGVFERVRIGASGELAWDDQVDLCPDALYLKVTGKKPEDVFPGLQRERAHARDQSVLRDRDQNVSRRSLGKDAGATTAPEDCSA